ncbi:hypothetical protein [Gordonia aichiensis]|uniref:Mce-associated membrane protein n=1 Tax=Gordonia aichiensis NBRC 108223 TaxID=1220583 RepID=L7KER5_9ACTN|nr:hypothetical protein [Gordonia aichiensis]GAC47104.1 hypothetical protein GOACH_03_01200 [Gordonia aichiensis NBRC 108223]
MTTMTDPTTASKPTDPHNGTCRSHPLVSILAMVAVVVAAACVAYFGYRAYEVYFVDKPIQSARDEAVSSAEQAIINVTTVDPKNTADWKRRVDSSLTGKAKEQITAQDVSTLNQQITQAGPQAATLTSRLKRSAPTEVNADAGTAKVLIYVDATAKRENEAGVTQTMGFSVSMTKTDGTWKASNISPLDGIDIDDPGQSANQQSGNGQSGSQQSGQQQGGGN